MIDTSTTESDVNTRTYPRTMQQAFGPHTSDELHPIPDTDYSLAWYVSMCIVAVVAVFVIVATGG